MIQTAQNNNHEQGKVYPGRELLLEICQLLRSRGISVNDPNLVLPADAKRDFSHLYNEAHKNIIPSNRFEKREESQTSNRIEPASTLSDHQLYKWALRITHNLDRLNYVDLVIENNGGPKTFTRLKTTKSQLEAPVDNLNTAQALDRPGDLEHTLDLPTNNPRAIQDPNSTTQELPLLQRTPANIDETTERPSRNSQHFDLTTFSMSQNANEATTIEIGGFDWDIADQSFSSQFTKLKPIGQGGFGKVYKAQNFTGNTVAIKFLTNPADEKKFITEARIADQLGNHDACVKIHSSGKVRVAHKDGRELFLPYISMEQLNPEGTLQAYIKQQSKDVLQDKERYEGYVNSAIQSFVLTVCEGISYAHSKGIVHRDLKPDNVCKTVHDVARVIDWGMAYIFEGATLTNVNSRSETTDGGTLAFMPPEQFAQVISPQTDVYAIGAILYNIVTLTRPANLARVPDAVKEGRALIEEYIRYWRDVLVPEGSNSEEKSRISIDPAESIAKFLPDALKLIIKKAMSPLPEDRYNTVAELKSDLENFMSGHITIAEKEAYGWFGGKQRSVKLWAKRNSIAIKITAGFAVVVGITAYWWAGSNASNKQSKHARETLSGVVAKFDSDLDWKKDADSIGKDLSEVLATHQVYANDPIAGEVYNEVKERKEEIVDNFRAERDRKISEYNAFLKDADEVIASADNRDKPFNLSDDTIANKLDELLDVYGTENPDWLSNLDRNVFTETQLSNLRDKVAEILIARAARGAAFWSGSMQPSDSDISPEERESANERSLQFIVRAEKESKKSSLARILLKEILSTGKLRAVTDEEIATVKTPMDVFVAVMSMDLSSIRNKTTRSEYARAVNMIENALQADPDNYLLNYLRAEVSLKAKYNPGLAIKFAQNSYRKNQNHSAQYLVLALTKDITSNSNNNIDSYREDLDFVNKISDEILESENASQTLKLRVLENKAYMNLGFIFKLNNSKLISTFPDIARYRENAINSIEKLKAQDQRPDAQYIYSLNRALLSITFKEDISILERECSVVLNSHRNDLIQDFISFPIAIGTLAIHYNDISETENAKRLFGRLLDYFETNFDSIQKQDAEYFVRSTACRQIIYYYREEFGIFFNKLEKKFPGLDRSIFTEYDEHIKKYQESLLE